MPDNFLLFLSETTPPTPPEMVLHGRTNKAATHTQHTFCVYALLLAGISYFTHFTKKMGSMSREKLEKMGNFAKNFVLIGLLQPSGDHTCLEKISRKVGFQQKKWGEGSFYAFWGIPKEGIIVVVCDR